RVVAGLLDDVQFDDLLLEQAQSPTREPLGRRRPGQGDQFRLRRPVENPRPGGVRIVFAGQRPSSTSRRRVRLILFMLVSNAAAIALSLQPSPPPTRPPSEGCAPSSATVPDACPRRSSPPAARAPRCSTSPHFS